MKIFLFSVAIFALATLLLAENTENYEVAKETAEAAGKSIKRGQRYAFYEYWTVSRLTTKFPDCFTGWKHIRLVVGEVEYTDSSKKDLDFVATAWDLSVDPAEAYKKYEGGKTDYDYEEWEANTNSKGKRVSNQHVWAGTVSKSDRSIKKASKDFLKLYPTYSLYGGNCKTYAGWLYEQIA